MTYQEAIEAINSLLVFGSQPGLERVSKLVKRIGSPDHQLRFVHVAGTNGKGSVCAYLSSILQQAGCKTGLFISPYVLEFRERFQINGEMIPKETLAAIVSEIFPVVQEMKEEGKIITEFEMVLAAALKWYAQENCDIVVLETGLGGRFDATNIIDTPLASVIMSISLDHTAILGDTYEKIAFEKCGIIKEGGKTILYGEQPEGVKEVVQRIAADRHNELTIAEISTVKPLHTGLTGSVFTFESEDWNGGERAVFSIPLIGAHQFKNAVTALHTVIALRKQGVDISDEAVRQGLQRVSFPARLELLKNDPVVLLDGAHNPGGAAALASAVNTYLSGNHKIAVVGMLADKDVHTALSLLIPLFDSVIAVAPPNPRAMSAKNLAAEASVYHIPTEAAEDYAEAYRKALKLAHENDPPAAIVVFGSLYLASEMRRIILQESDTQADKI